MFGALKMKWITFQDLSGIELGKSLIPQFEIEPDVLVWRSQIFLKVSSTIYREAWWYHVLEPQL